MFKDIYEHLDSLKFSSFEGIVQAIIDYWVGLIEGFTPCDEDWQEAKAIAKDYSLLKRMKNLSN